VFGNESKVILVPAFLYVRNSLSLIRGRKKKKASSSNIPHEEASLESRIFAKIIEQWKKLMEESIERFIDRALDR
jgi:hypothetical protein